MRELQKETPRGCGAVYAVAMLNFGPAKLYIKPADCSTERTPLGESDTFIGECDAFIMESSDGRKVRFGDPAALFDLEQTEEDKALLRDMKIGF